MRGLLLLVTLLLLGAGAWRASIAAPPAPRGSLDEMLEESRSACDPYAGPALQACWQDGLREAR